MVRSLQFPRRHGLSAIYETTTTLLINTASLMAVSCCCFASDARYTSQHFGNEVLRWIKSHGCDHQTRVVSGQNMWVRRSDAIALDQTH